jgi:hypothetical protein
LLERCIEVAPGFFVFPTEVAALPDCQSACNFDHLSALNFDQATEMISGA